MKSVIYLDELLLTNFVLAALFLTAAGLLCATVCTGVRLCTGAALAAVSALGLLAPELPGAVAVGYKIFTGCAVVAAAYGLPGRGRFARLCAWYALLNLLLCGAVVLPGVQANNLSVLLPVRPGQLLLCCAGVYGLLRGLPSMALGSPPETGASIIWIPAFSHSAAIALDSSGAMELMSMTSRPSCAPSATPPLPSTAARTCGELGTMVMTTSLFEATSALLSPRAAPQETTSSSASFANGSNAVTA